jgi:hypothetical protein
MGRALLGSLPVVGSAAVEFFQTVVVPPLQRRQAAWMDAVAKALEELRERGKLSFDELSRNEPFITAVTRAAEAARKTHQQTKLDALRNAVLNVALSPAVDDAQTQMHINYVDELTDWHLRVLACAQETTVAEDDGRSVGTIIKRAFPELKDRGEFCEQVWKDLFDRGLVYLENLNVMVTVGGRWTTDSGDEFLSLIRFTAT